MSNADISLLKENYQEICIDIESHNYMANFWNNTHIYIGIPSTILSSIVTASVFSNLLKTDILVGIISLIVTALSALSTFLNPSEKYLSHKTAKSTLIILRNKTKFFLSIMENGQEIDKEDLTSYQSSIEQIFSTKPQVPEWVKDVAIKRVKKMQKILLSQ